MLTDVRIKVDSWAEKMPQVCLEKSVAEVHTRIDVCVCVSLCMYSVCLSLCVYVWVRVAGKGVLRARMCSCACTYICARFVR